MAEENKDQKTVKEPENGLPDWVTPLLTGTASAASSLGISYFCWIKPLQEDVKTLRAEVAENKKEIGELKQLLKEKEQKRLEGIDQEREQDRELFQVKKTNSSKRYAQVLT
jgi:hypothetical protein